MVASGLGNGWDVNFRGNTREQYNKIKKEKGAGRWRGYRTCSTSILRDEAENTSLIVGFENPRARHVVRSTFGPEDRKKGWERELKWNGWRLTLYCDGTITARVWLSSQILGRDERDDLMPDLASHPMSWLACKDRGRGGYRSKRCSSAGEAARIATMFW